jgi:hypothetical protein
VVKLKLSVSYTPLSVPSYVWPAGIGVLLLVSPVFPFPYRKIYSCR